MKTYLHRALLILTLIAGLPGVSTAAVGRTEGSFAVSPTGSFTYQIPLWTPPGAGGIQPKLTLTYDSQRGTGITGPGWALNGLSAITRCNRTVAQDGFVGQVLLGYSDILCLDGKHLRVDISSGYYGQPGTKYDTELAEFSKITLVSTTNTDPDYFTAKTKDGLTYEFGNTPDSRVKPSASSLFHYMWLVNKVTDRAGNSYKVTYGLGAAGTSNTAVPISIEYSPTSAGASTYLYSVTFDYAAKAAEFPNTTDPGTRSYVAGNLIVNTNLLKAVKVSHSGSLVKRYALGYELAPTTLRPRISTITECASADATNCLAATTLGYQNGAAGMTTTAIPAASGSTYLGSPDFDGDGRSDVMYVESGTVKVARGTSSGGFLPAISLGAIGNGLVGYADLSNKGFDDVVIKQGSSFVAYSWIGGAVTTVSLTVAPPGSPNKYGLVDVNGDGRGDFMAIIKAYNASTRLYTLTAHTYLNSSQAKNSISFGTVKTYSTTVSCPTSPATPCDADILTGTEFGPGPRLDFDGDGVSNVVMRMLLPTAAIGASIGYVRFLAFNGTTFADIGGLSGQQGAAVLPQIAGFALVNDDSCTDVLMRSPASVITSACGGVAGEAISVSGTPLASIDWNSDSRTDVLIQYGSNFGALVSTEAGFGAVVDTGVPISPSAAANAFALDFDGDGLMDLGTWSSSGISVYRHALPSTPPDLVTSITDGFGVNVSPTYGSILNGNYTIGTTAVSPEQDFARALYVVTSLTSTSGATDGSPGTYTQNFWYYEGRENLDGRGFEGFKRVRITDTRNQLIRNIYRATDFPYTGMVTTDELLQGDGTPITRTENLYGDILVDPANNNWRHFVYLDSSVTEVFEAEPAVSGSTVNGVSFRKTTVDPTVYDAYGNATTIVTSVQDTFPGSPLFGALWTTTVTHTVTPNVVNWCLNLPTQTSVTKTAPGSAATTRTTSFTPDYVNCRINAETVEPGDPRWQVATGYGYDGFGNVNQIAVTPVSGQNQTARTAYVGWGATGRKPESVTNAMNQVSYTGWDYRFGTRNSVTDPNGLTTSWTYDTFGRLLREDRPDQTHTEYALSACGAGNECFTAAKTKVDVKLFPVGAGASPMRIDTQELDIFDRPIRTLQPLLGSVISEVTNSFDQYGRLSARSIPHSKDAASHNVSYLYDLLGRTSQVRRPVNQATPGTLVGTSIAYKGPTTITTDSLGHTSKLRRNPLGLIVQSFDALDHDTDYEYDAFGNTTKVRDYRDTDTVLTYNVRGMKMSSNDPDMGSWTYDYYPLGELRRQTDAKGQITDFEYDALSRLKKRLELEAHSVFTYGVTQASHDVGQLAKVEQLTPGGSLLYSETYGYDAKGRLSSQQIQSDATYQYDYGYDALTGLQSSVSYPSVPGYRLSLQYVYQNAMLQEVKDSTTNTAYWHINAVNPLGQVTQELLGNGVITNRTIDAVTGRASNVTSGLNGGTALRNENYLYDDAGNVTQRQKYSSSLVTLSENFHYDALQRLTSSDLGGVGNLTTTYDDIGNVTSRSDIANGATWEYADPAHKHAVTKAGTNTYSYDANGNAVTRSGKTISWTSYNYPTAINGPNKKLTFSYGPDRGRFKQVYENGGVIETTVYIGAALEKVSLSGVNDYRHYIRANGATIAVVSRTGGTTTTRYLLNDHLGSIASILDSSGAQIVRESFEAFGARRDAEEWDPGCACSTLAQMASITRHGFTGHEMIGGYSMGLIHMNGRVMDSVTGRFLSADPLVQFPFNGQSLNRYSYVLNNPLSATDPSGFAGEYGDYRSGWNEREYDSGFSISFGWAWPTTCVYCNRYVWKQPRFARQNLLPMSRATPAAAEGPAVIAEEGPKKAWDELGFFGKWAMLRNRITEDIYASKTDEQLAEQITYAEQRRNDIAISREIGVGPSPGLLRAVQGLGRGAPALTRAAEATAARGAELVVGSGARQGVVTVARDTLAGTPNVMGRVQSLPFRSGSMSSVSLEGLPFTELGPQAFREAARVLGAGGRLTGSTGPAANLAAIRSGLEQAGFRDIKVGYDLGDAAGNYRVIFSGTGP
ncbi:MAG: SpvB/TcaC N-terminal domain-containing protein [Pseudomonadota bacterium]